MRLQWTWIAFADEADGDADTGVSERDRIGNKWRRVFRGDTVSLLGGKKGNHYTSPRILKRHGMD